MTIIAMNRWKVLDEEVAKDFQRDWERLTGEMLASCGAISNTLHCSDNGDFVAIAVWPSREAWEKLSNWATHPLREKYRTYHTEGPELLTPIAEVRR